MSLVRVRFLPEVFSGPELESLGFDRTIAVNHHLAGQADLLLMSDASHHGHGVGAEIDRLDRAWLAEVIHAFFYIDPARATQAQAATVDICLDGAMHFDAGLARFGPENGPGGHFDFLLFVDERDLGHGPCTPPCLGECALPHDPFVAAGGDSIP